MAAMMYSSGESRLLIMYVSKTMYPLNKMVPPIAYSKSTVCEKGRKSPTIPVIPAAIQRFVNRTGERVNKCLQRAMRPPKSHGPMPEKSY